jgi:hypothetical protein
MKSPSRMTFITCLLGAPALFAIVPALFMLGGEYLSRFGYVGNLALFVSLPTWLTVFAWLAWRAAKRGETELRPYVMAGLVANAASLVIFPLLIFAAEALGANLSGMLAESFQEAQAGSDAEQEQLSLTTAALFAGFAAFFVGLFVVPVLGSIFGALARKLKLVKG